MCVSLHWAHCVLISTALLAARLSPPSGSLPGTAGEPELRSWGQGASRGLWLSQAKSQGGLASLQEQQRAPSLGVCK